MSETRTRTIGTGGDFADWNTALEWLRVNENPLTHDYELVQISDCTLAAEMTNTLTMNQHRLRLYCPFEDGHKGNPTKGFVTNTGVRGLYLWTDDSGWPGDSRAGDIYVENLRIVCTGNAAYALRTGGRGQKTRVNNVIIVGNNFFDQYGFYTLNVNDYCQCWIKNMKVYNTGGIGIGNNTGGAVAPGVVQQNYIENCTVYNCGRNAAAANSYGISFAGLSWQNWNTRNVVSIRDAGAAGADWDAADDCCTKTYCAASDGSLPADSSNRNYVVPADEFESLDVANDNFLRLIGHGHKTAGASASPLSGASPLEVQFTASLEITRSGAGDLATAGGEPAYATDDIEGHARPGDDGLYSVGAHEFQYEWTNVVT